jgi:siroheme synthase
VITGHGDPGKTAGGVDWDRLATAVDTLVILMGIATLPVIAARLIAAGRDPATPAAVIERGLTGAQRVVTATLADLAERAAAHLASPAVIVIGDVAGLPAQYRLATGSSSAGNSVMISTAGPSP